jgi:hypothetical protein
MSSVSGVATPGLSLMDQLKTQNQQSLTGQQSWNDQFASMLQQAGADPSKVSDIENQIRTAVQSAKQSGGSDPRASVKQAIDKVLTDNGVDPAKFDAAAKSKKGGKGHKHGGHHKGGGAGNGVPAPSTPATGAINATNPTTSPFALGAVDVEG